MKWLKNLFCKHDELELLTPIEVDEKSMYGIWTCKKCGKTIFKTVEGNFLT